MSQPPLADLHRHLDGSLRPETFCELAEAKGLDVPVPRFHAEMGLDAALGCFAATLAVLDTPEAVARVASEICEDALADGVSTLEVRFGPFLHGEDAGSFVDAALEGLAGRAGLILCGLYGDAPERLMALVELARPGVVGLDLAGGPLPSHRFGLRDYAPAFRAAARAGLGRTVHAGEGRAPEEIRVAIEELGAQRIGHGTTLLQGPALVELVLQREVAIEACLTSNVHVGALASVEEHRLVEWLERGVRVCVNTDNTLMSAVTASSELAVAQRLVGMTRAGVDALLRNGHSAAFG